MVVLAREQEAHVDAIPRGAREGVHFRERRDEVRGGEPYRTFGRRSLQVHGPAHAKPSGLAFHDGHERRWSRCGVDLRVARRPPELPVPPPWPPARGPPPHAVERALHISAGRTGDSRATVAPRKAPAAQESVLPLVTN